MPMPNLCRACFDGVYPIELPDPEHLGKHLLELDSDDRARTSTACRPRCPAVAPATPSTAPDRPRRQEPHDRAAAAAGATYEAAGVSIDAGDKAVELMKVWIDKARRPEMMGGIGGFAGLFDASALKSFDHPMLATSRRRRRHQGRDRAGDGHPPHDRLRPRRDARRRPRGLRRRAAVPHRLHRHRPGRPRADRRDRAGHRRGVRPGRLRAGRRRDRRAPRACSAPTSTTSRARPPASSRRPTCSAPAGSRPATSSSRWRRAGCTPTATRWCATCCSPRRGAGWSLDRHVDELGRTLGEELLEPTTVYAKACLDLARSTATHAMSHVTGGGLAANLERVLPDDLVATARPRHLDPGAGLRPGPPGRRRWSRRRWSGPSTAGSGWSRSPRPTTSTGRVEPARRRTGCDSWVCGEVGEATERPGAAGRLGHAARAATRAGEGPDRGVRLSRQPTSCPFPGSDVRESTPGQVPLGPRETTGETGRACGSVAAS